MTDAICDATAVEQRALIRSRTISARELLAAHLERVAAVNPTVNAVVAIDEEVAQTRAAAVDEQLAAGKDPGPLAGLVTAEPPLVDTSFRVRSPRPLTS